jgi:Domain of unknown function (DUF892)
MNGSAFILEQPLRLLGTTVSEANRTSPRMAYSPKWSRKPFSPPAANISAMRFSVLKLNFLRDLLIEELRDLYSAETQLVSALPKMAEAAASPELASSFEHHLGETRGHVSRLESIFNQIGEKSSGETVMGQPAAWLDGWAKIRWPRSCSKHEEGEANKKLTSIAESQANVAASSRA